MHFDYARILIACLVLYIGGIVLGSLFLKKNECSVNSFYVIFLWVNKLYERTYMMKCMGFFTMSPPRFVRLLKTATKTENIKLC